MRFQYTEKKVNLPENVHKYAEKKVMKLERFFGDDAEALVTFSVDKDRNIAEITVHASNMYFRARESTSDMFASIDAAVATMERQIRKNKTRLSRRLRQDAFVRTPDVTSFAPEEPEEGTFEIGATVLTTVSVTGTRASVVSAADAPTLSDRIIVSANRKVISFFLSITAPPSARGTPCVRSAPCSVCRSACRHDKP